MHRILALSLTSTLIFAWSFLASPSTANAGGKAKKKGGAEAIFKKLDADNDGKLSKSEFAKLGELGKKAAAATAKKAGKGDKLFSKLDTNGDGSLSLEEFKKMSEMKKKAK